jgi:CubicO group peptidase (beta-lactamase class C family)
MTVMPEIASFKRSLTAAAILLLIGCSGGMKSEYQASSATRLTNGWQSSSPEAQGMDGEQLRAMVDTIEEDDKSIRSVIVVRNGYVVLEEYFPPFEAGTKHVVRSVSKSITSALIGIAIEQGYIQGVDQPLLDLLPGREVANLDTDKEAVTLEQVLMMANGLECRDSYLHRWRGIREMDQTDDWVQYMLDLPMSETPGTRFEYCNGGTFLLSAIIQENTGITAFDFAKAHLFDPLGITDVAWEANPQGMNLGFTGVEMAPLDMAKFGYLYLNAGMWDGDQIVPASWVETSMQGHISAGTLSDEYGYQWWVDRRGYVMALGYGGQYIVIVPEENLVVVFASELNEREFFTPETLLNTFIIPAAE